VTSLSEVRVLVVGLGGLGCPVAMALAEAGVGSMLLSDDDTVDESNLHRQVLFQQTDVGLDKVEVGARRLEQRYPALRVESCGSRFLPDCCERLAAGVDLIVEGADNFATKFLAADAARLAGCPVVHGAAVRWHATAWAVGRAGSPCYRCLFEDLPEGEAQPNCAEAGVMGPVVGFAGALMADLALRVLSGDHTAFGSILTYDGLTDRLRRVAVSPRSDCALCGVAPTIQGIDETRYTQPSCAA